MTDRTSIIGGIVCFTLVMLLWSICPKGVAGAVSPQQGDAALWAGGQEIPGKDAEGGVSASAGPPGALFSGEGVFQFTLEADFKNLKGDRSQESEDRPGRMLFTTRAGEEVIIPLKVRTRGNFRLQRGNCSFPPLRLDLPKDELKGTVLDGQNKIKLVTHCRDRERYEQNLLEEFLAYRIYNLLTDVSIRVHLARVRYVDTSGKKKPEERFAFLLESKKAMASRLDGAFPRVKQAHPSHFQAEAAGRMYLFQYLIGNVDWSLVYFHNVKVMRIGSEYYPIPYDFDWSGLVYAPYARPHPELEQILRSVRQRLFRGFCSDGIDYDPLARQFLEKKDEILTLIAGVPGLSEGNAKSAGEYVQGFYEVLEDERKVEKKILKGCRSLARQ